MYAAAVVFAAGLLAAGLAPGIEVFVAARFLQGLGGGAMSVALYVAGRPDLRPHRPPRIFGAFAASWVIPSMVGPTIAGVVAETVGWRWVFLGVVGLAAAATLAMRPGLRGLVDRPEPSTVATGGRLALAVVVAAAVVVLDLSGRADGATAYVAAAVEPGGGARRRTPACCRRAPSWPAPGCPRSSLCAASSPRPSSRPRSTSRSCSRSTTGCPSGCPAPR